MTMYIVKLFTFYLPIYLFCKIFNKELPYETIETRNIAVLKEHKELSEAQTFDEWCEVLRKNSVFAPTTNNIYATYLPYMIKKYVTGTSNVREWVVTYIDDTEQSGTYIYYINNNKKGIYISPNVFEELFPIKPIRMET